MPTIEEYDDLVERMFPKFDIGEDEIYWAAYPENEDEAVVNFDDDLEFDIFYDCHYGLIDDFEPHFLAREEVLRNAIRYLQDRDYYDTNLSESDSSSP